tara:strand:+ start:1719 stop:1931 length:213 start_codon:yes stop_codon:yes gene_type:complete
MTHRSIFDEIALHTYMQKLGLTVEEAQEAMSLYANNKKFDNELDATYNVDDDVIDEEWDTWEFPSIYKEK